MIKLIAFTGLPRSGKDSAADWLILRGNGSLKGYDEYAADNNFGFEPASQNFWVTHPDHGITFDAPVYADAAVKRVAKLPWVSVPGK